MQGGRIYSDVDQGNRIVHPRWRFNKPIFSMNDENEYEYHEYKNDQTIPTEGNLEYFTISAKDKSRFVYLKDSYLEVGVSLKAADGATALTAVPGAAGDNLNNCALINPAMSMFTDIRLEIDGVDVEGRSLMHTHISNLISGLIKYSDDYADSHAIAMGWKSDDGAGGHNPVEFAAAPVVDDAATVTRNADYNSGFVVRKALTRDAAGTSNIVATFYFRLEDLHPFGQVDQVFLGVETKLSMKKAPEYIILERGGDAGAATNNKLQIRYLSWWIPTLRPREDLRATLYRQIADKSKPNLLWNTYQTYQYSWNGERTAFNETIALTANKVNYVAVIVTTGAQNQTLNHGIADATVNFTSAYIRIGSRIFPSEPYKLKYNAEDADAVANRITNTRLWHTLLKIADKNNTYDTAMSVDFHKFKTFYRFLIFDTEASDPTMFEKSFDLSVNFECIQTSNANRNVYVVVYNEKAGKLSVQDGRITMLQE